MTSLSILCKIVKGSSINDVTQFIIIAQSSVTKLFGTFYLHLSPQNPYGCDVIYVDLLVFTYSENLAIKHCHPNISHLIVQVRQAIFFLKLLWNIKAQLTVWVALYLFLTFLTTFSQKNLDSTNACFVYAIVRRKDSTYVMCLKI